jgi:hypothetical protein
LLPSGTYYEITTTATYNGTIIICIRYDESNLPPSVPEDNVTLQQYDETTNTWVDITTSCDTVNNIICGDTDQLALFGVMYQVEEIIEVTMELPEGWSMISLPVKPEVATPATIFPDAVVVFKYQKGMGYLRVPADENLEVGMGYWISLHNPQSYVIRGTEITEYTMPVEDAWYFIGGCTSPAQTMVTSGSIVVIYGFTPGVGYDRLPESDPLEPGKAYWILIRHTSEGAEFTADTSVSK